MYCAITHLTVFGYSDAVSDSVMEVRKQPISNLYQRCVQFDLKISPSARLLPYKDYLGNTVHVFDIPGRHKQLAIRAQAIVETRNPPALPEALPVSNWAGLNEAQEDRDLHDFIFPSTFSRPSPLLDALAQELNIHTEQDPLTFVRHLNSSLYQAFAYDQKATKVDSPIDVALSARRGVCQDFSHIMIAFLRQWQIPARYISGYLFHTNERSLPSASHAWVEAWLPSLGWVGFDPTNNLVCGERHIAVAVGRDYADVPPTRGVFKGDAQSALEASVKVMLLSELPTQDHISYSPEIQMPKFEMLAQQQQQQQQ